MTDYTGLQFGKYRLQEKIGEGGFADVYRGKHVDLQWLAAVKILKTQLNQSELDKFRDEAQTLATLQHPHIIRILDYEKSSSNRPPFLILEYMAHGALSKYRGTPQPPQFILPYIKQIAGALQYLHNQRKLHLDVKPANILLKNESEALLSDFGIAKSIGQSAVNEVIGSVHYIAPEYLQQHPGPASDQYSLAIVVYELLCGVCPFTGSVLAIQRAHIEDEPPPIQRKMPTLSPAIWQVLKKALAKAPHQRFNTVTEFANALEEAILDSSKIPGVPPSDNPVPSPTIESFPDTVPLKPSKGPGPTGTPTRTQPINRGGAIPRAYSAATRYVFEGHKGEVYSVSWAADSRRLASASMDKTIHVWSIDTNRPADIYTYLRSIKVVAWSYNSRYLAAMGSNQIITVRDMLTKEITATYEAHRTSGRGLAFSLAWSPNSTSIASGGDSNKICIWDATLGSDRTVYSVHSGYVTALSWSPDGRYLASGSDDRTVQIWDMDARKIVTTHDGYRGEISALAWSPDGHYLASACLDEVKIWNIKNANFLPAIYRHKSINALTWSPDGQYLASAGDDAKVEIRDIAALQLLFTYTEHLAPVRSVAWAPDGRYLASCDEDKRVCVWNFA